jgi:transposase
MNEIVDAVVDDLTGQQCASCGTTHELTRPNAVVVGGRVHGIVVCTDCEHSR